MFLDQKQQKVLTHMSLGIQYCGLQARQTTFVVSISHILKVHEGSQLSGFPKIPDLQTSHRFLKTCTPKHAVLQTIWRSIEKACAYQPRAQTHSIYKNQHCEVSDSPLEPHVSYSSAAEGEQETGRSLSMYSGFLRFLDDRDMVLVNSWFFNVADQLTQSTV